MKKILALALVIALLTQFIPVSAEEIATVTYIKGTGASDNRPHMVDTVTSFNGSVYAIGGYRGRDTNGFFYTFLYKVVNGKLVVVHRFGAADNCLCSGLNAYDGYLYFSVGGIIWRMDKTQKITKYYTVASPNDPYMINYGHNGTLLIATFDYTQSRTEGSPAADYDVRLFDIKTKKEKILAEDVEMNINTPAIALNKDGDNLVLSENAWDRDISVMDLAYPESRIRYNVYYFNDLYNNGLNMGTPVYGCAYINNFLVLSVCGALVGFDEDGLPINLYGDPLDPEAPQLSVGCMTVTENGTIYGMSDRKVNGVWEEIAVKITIPAKYHKIVSKKPVMDASEDWNPPE